MVLDFKIKWAINENERFVQNPILLSAAGIYIITEVPILKLFLNVNLGDLDTSLSLANLFKLKNNQRFLKIIDHCKIGGYLDPPILIYNNGHFLFENGRHRTIIAWHTGACSIPIAYSNGPFQMLF